MDKRVGRILQLKFEDAAKKFAKQKAEVRLKDHFRAYGLLLESCPELLTPEGWVPPKKG